MSVVAYFQMNMIKLEKLLKFPFESGKDGSSNNCFIVKRPFLYSIILFAATTLEIPLYFNDFRRLLVSKDFDFGLIDDNVRGLFDFNLSFRDFQFKTELHYNGIVEGMRFLARIIKTKPKSTNYLSISFERFLNQFQLPSNVFERIIQSFQRTISQFDMTKFVYHEDSLLREDMFLACAACFSIVSADCEILTFEKNSEKIEANPSEHIKTNVFLKSQYSTECLASFLARSSSDGWHANAVLRDYRLRLKIIDGEMLCKVNAGSLLATFSEPPETLSFKNEPPKFDTKMLIDKSKSSANIATQNREFQLNTQRLPIERYVFNLLNNSSVNSQIFESLVAEQVVFTQLRDYLSIPIEFHSFISVC